MSDLRIAVRSLRRQPVFCLTAILTLALGIGANTAIFSIFDAVLLRPLPYRDAARLAMVWQTKPNGQHNPVSPANYLEWTRLAASFEQLAAITVQPYNVRGREGAIQVPGARISSSFFATLGVEPALGRGFTSRADESQPGPVAILSHGFWQDHLGTDRDVLGKPLNANGESYTVVGVLPKDFEFAVLKGIQIWTPLKFESTQSLKANNLAVIGRVRRDLDIAQADREMREVARNLQSQFPDTNQGWGATVISLQDYVVRDVRPALRALFLGVGFVLLIACVNVANLLLARSESRRREVAIRSALGASRMRLLRQILTETMLLAAAGCIAGLLLAKAALGVLVKSGAKLPRIEEVTLDVRVLAFSLAITVLTGLWFGLFPAHQLLAGDVMRVIRETGRSLTKGRRTRWSQNMLAISEIALALMLLVGAGLMARSLLWLQREDRGFRPEQLLSFRISIPGLPAQRQLEGDYRRMLASLEQLPGVRAVGTTTNLPLEGFRQLGMYFQVAGAAAASTSEKLTAACDLITPGFFKALGIPLLKGREFTARDQEGAPPVVAISSTLAQRYFPGENPIGRQLIVGSPGRPGSTVPREIVGVVGDIRYLTKGPDDSVEIYLPFLQASWAVNYVLIRTERDAISLAPAVRAAARDSGWQQPISELLSMEDRIDNVNGGHRWNSKLAAVFAAIALVLAAVGIYGVISCATAQRTQEIGIRMALGATRSDIIFWIVRQACLLAAAGLVAGLTGHFAVSRLLRTLLYGTGPNDLPTLLAAAAILGSIAVIAGYLPARRAVRGDPMGALRAE